MAVDLATAKQFVAQKGIQPPPSYPGGADQWAIDYLQNAVNAGVPGALKAAGLWTGAEGMGGGQGDQNAAQGYASNYMSAAPASEWLGKRNPTPSELRRYAADTRQSEDYARFSDAQLAQWIGGHWNAQQGAFFNDYGDRVEKPTESGPQSHAAGASTGISGAGGGGMGGGGRAAAPAPAPASAAYQALDNPLQAQLYNLIQSRGVAGQRRITNAQSLAGGGVLSWGQPPPPGQQQPSQPAPAAPTAPAAPPAPGTMNVGAGPGVAGSKTSQPFAPSQPFATNSAAGGGWGAWGAPPKPAAGSLDSAILGKFGTARANNQWWM